MKDPINQWLAFIDMERGDLLDMAEKENNIIKEAKKSYETLTRDAEVKRLAEIRLMSKLEEQAALASARAKGTKDGLELGKKQGLELGKKEGLELGKKQEKFETAKKMKSKNMPIKDIIEFTGLTQKEIENL